MSRHDLRLQLLLGGLLLGCTARTPPAPVARPDPASAQPPAISCRPDATERVAATAGTDAHCVIDVGSRNVKLVVAAARGRDARSLSTLRQCRSRLQLADRTRDPGTGAGRPLSSEDQDKLLMLLSEYRRLCEQSGGRMHAAVATEWARTATNIAEIQRRVAAETALSLRVLSREEEARAAYLSATRGARGKLVLDFGSRSLQLAYWATDSDEPEALSVPLGIDEAGDRFLSSGSAGYQRGRVALADAWKTSLAPLVARARQARDRGALSPELHSLGENGDLALAVTGRLWPGTPPRALDEAGYAAAVKSIRPAGALPPAALEIGSDKLRSLSALYEANPPLLDELRRSSLKRVFGNKMLVYPVLIEWLHRELGLEKVVLLPQEMTEGILVMALAGRPATATAPSPPER